MLSVATGYTQTIITGKVTDNKGNAVAGANVSIKDSYDGATTKADGSYSFETILNGNVVVVVNSPGYKPFDKVVALKKGTLAIDATLKEEVEELTAATVTAGVFEAGDKKRAATVLSTLDVLTTGAANADISAAIRTLPGAQQPTEQSGLSVRGGSVYETKQFIDGTLVNNPYYAGAPGISQRGRFSPVLFKGTVFSTGGYSALYGQALSSALILESVDMPDRSEASASISSIFLGAGFQHLAENKKSSWGANLSYTNTEPYFNLVSQTVDYFDAPVYYGGDLNFRKRTKSGGMLKFLSSFSYNTLGIRRENIDDETLKNSLNVKDASWYNILSWCEYFANSWKMELGLGYSMDSYTYKQHLLDGNNMPVDASTPYMAEVYNFNIDSRENLAQSKLVLEKKYPGLNAIRFGAEYRYSHNSNERNENSMLLTDSYAAVFAETNLHFTNKLVFTLGGRAEYSSVINSWNIAPRAAFAFKTGKNSQVSAAYGMFYQKPDNDLLIYDTNLKYQQSSHYIINYQINELKRTFRVDAFYKTYDDLVKTYPALTSSGTGYAKGVELFWRDKQTLRFFDYWLSYSYLDTKRDYLNYPRQLQPNFAASHTASIVVKSFIPKISTGFNISYSFASGRPYYNLMLDQAQQQYNITDQGKTVCYNDLGISANYLTQWKGVYAVLFASVSNVLGQKQVYGYAYSHDGNVKRAITPTADRFYFIGLFLSWGVDRRQDVIDGRL